MPLRFKGLLRAKENENTLEGGSRNPLLNRKTSVQKMKKECEPGNFYDLLSMKMKAKALFQENQARLETKFKHQLDKPVTDKWSLQII